MKRVFVALLLLACFAAKPVFADCTNPAGHETAQFYNNTWHTYQFCNGTNWIAEGTTNVGSGALTLISTQTASGSATLQWTGLGSTYYYYKLLCTDLILSSTSATLYLQFGEGGTPTWKTSNYEYVGLIVDTGSAGTYTGYESGSATGVILSNGSPETWGSNPESIELTISNPGSALYKYVNGTWTQYGGSFGIFSVSGEYTGDTTAVTAVRLNPSTGTITSGQCSLYGINS